jgi:hypothetical protein
MNKRWANYKVIQDLFFVKNYFLKNIIQNLKVVNDPWDQIYRELGIQIFAQLFTQYFSSLARFVGLFKHHALLFLQSAHCSMVL